MSTATDSVDRWTEVTISVGTDRFDGAIHPLNTTVYVRLKSLTDHLHMDYEGQYYKVTHDPRYSEAVHIRDRQVKANGDFLRKRSWSGRESREYLYLPLPLVEQYLSDLRPSRIRNAEGRTNARTFQTTLVEAIRRGFEKQRTANAPSLNVPDLETIIRQHFDQAQAIVQRIAEERRQQAEQQRRKREAQALREREPQERARREAERRRQEEERRREEEKRRAARSRSTAPEPWWIVLGLSSSASQFEAERRYRELALKYHPDRGGDGPTMIALNIAIEQARRMFGV